MANKMFISVDWKLFRKLSASLQQAWFYGWTNCDACGVFELDEDYAKIDLGRKVTDEDYNKLKDFGVKKIDSLRFIFIDFILVNYVNLKPDYNPHKPAFRALESRGLTLNQLRNRVDVSSLQQACGSLEEEENKPISKNVFIEEVKKELTEDEKSYEKFKDWINLNASMVGKMKEPFTLEQCIKVKKNYDGELVKRLLLAMHNHKDLNKKVSAYLTFTNWASRDLGSKETPVLKMTAADRKQQQEKDELLKNITGNG